MKVVTAHTMQEVDRRAISEYGIPGRDLMEQAGIGCVQYIVAGYGRKTGARAIIVAGKGNNGGDGYVIARHLLEKGWQVQVIILTDQDQIKGDALTNLVRLPEEILSYCNKAGEFRKRFAKELQKADIIVDAMLGTGLQSEVKGVYLEAIEQINASGRKVVSVDIPSGVHGTTGRVMGQAIRADLTVSFAFAKLGHIIYPGADHTGRLTVVDIGIPQKLMDEAIGYEFLSEKSVAPLLVRRDRQAHKGSFGHSLIIAGSTGKTGAAALAANSCVRSGAGLVTLAVPASLNHILEIKTTEAMTVPLADRLSGHICSDALQELETLAFGKNSIAIGPGIGLHQETVQLVRNFVKSSKAPMVIDADGLNSIAGALQVLDRANNQPEIIITPHPGEMARLVGSRLPDVAAVRISVAQEFARTHEVFVVLKGARTIIASPDGPVAINGSGNPGMASGGMGDVLSGIIAALLSQGYRAWDACRIGVFIHGLAGDMVANDRGEVGIIASDLIEMLPYAFNRLTSTTYKDDSPIFIQ